jgi:protein involved in polysaccharide export with SLBB domain
MGFDPAILSQVNGASSAAPTPLVADKVEREIDEQNVAEELARQSVVEEKTKELKPFGYELFSSMSTSSGLPVNTPVPADYKMGPGDSVKVQLYGKESGSFELAVNNEGNVDIPDLGPIGVLGLSYEEVKNVIVEKYNQQKIGVQAFVTMGQLKTIQVFLVGEVFRPGTLTLNSLATITTALFDGGGVSEIGSLRNIQLKRNGRTISTLDLYDLVVYGDIGSDIRLQQGDVIFVPTVRKIVSIDGEVRRPAIYEVKADESFKDLLNLAGGVLPNANSTAIQLVRNDPKQGLQIFSIDANNQTDISTKLTNGDFISVTKSNLEFTNAIRVLGAINSPQLVSLKQKPRLSDIVNRTSVLNNTDLEYGLIVRRAKLAKHTSVIQFKPQDVIVGTVDHQMQELDQVLLFNRASQNVAGDREERVTASNLRTTAEDVRSAEADYVQQNEREIFTPKQLAVNAANTFSRKQLLAPVIARIKSESSDKRAVQLYEVGGQVKFPGVYPIPVNNNLQNSIDAAGGLTEAAFLENAEITKVSFEGDSASTLHFQFSLSQQLKLDRASQVALESKDVLNISRIPDWYESNVVQLKGEVVFPGSYQISKGETLRSLIARAGGLTEKASIEGAVFTRDELRQKEQDSIDRAVEDLREQLANNNLSNSQFSKTIDYENATKVLDDLTNVTPIGRLVIDLDRLINDATSDDLVLKGGDELTIPNITPAISVIGEVFVPATHLFDSTLTVNDYIERAGGIREYGDESKVYIVRADGSVFVPDNSFWFTSEDTSMLRAGDTIVVPRDVTNYDNISLWQGVTQILYQTAVALAAIGSL